MSDNLNLVPSPASPGAVSIFQSSGVLDVGALQIWTSLDPTTPEGKAAIVMHMQGESSTPASDAINSVIAVRHVLAHRIEMLDEKTGELIEADRIVLIDDAGESIACVSTGVRRSLQLIVSLYGAPPYDPPMQLRLTQKQTRKGRRTFQLSPVIVADSKR